MAVTATFTADFSNFFDAIGKANVQLKGLDSESKFVERTLNRMTDAFSGRKLVQEAILAADAVERIGGKSKLTQDELTALGNKAQLAVDKLRALGDEVPKKLEDLAKSAQKTPGAFESLTGVMKTLNPLMAAFGASLSIGAVVAYAKEIGAFAGSMVDLSVQTGISTDRLQAFNLVGTGAGLTIEEITSASEQLSKRIGSGDESVAGALGKMNLTLDDLRDKNIDEVLFTIDKGLQGVANQFELADIKADLFGKSGAKLGRLFDGSLEEVINAAEESGAIIDEELLKKADEFDDAWAQGWIKFRAYAVEAIAAAADGLTEIANQANNLPFPIGGRQGPTSPRRIGQPAPGPAPLTPEQQAQRLAQQQQQFLNRFMQERGGALQVDMPGGPQFRIQGDQLINRESGPFPVLSGGNVIEGPGMKGALAESPAEKAMRDWVEATKKGAEEAERMAIRMAGEEQAAKDRFFWTLRSSEANKKLAKLMDSEVVRWKDSTGREMSMRAQDVGVMPNLNAGLTAGLMFGPGQLPTPQGFKGVTDATSKAMAQSMKSSMQGAFTDLPKTIIAAVTGGGDVAGAIGSLFGTSLLGEKTQLNKSISTGLGKILPKAFGDAMGLALPGIGALVGPLVGKLFGSLFSGGEGAKTNKLRDEAISKFTGITGDKGASQKSFREMAMAAGIAATELDRLFSTKRTADFEQSMDRMTARIKEFQTEQARMAAEREEDQQRLNAAIEKYGFTLAELGPALQKQNLDAQAKELIEDWRVLVAAGVEMTTVNDKMGESISKYLQEAVKLGVEVPRAFRPILEKMIDQGELTNEAGEAITDLEETGISFSETMTEGFDRVVSKLDELIQKLQDAGTAISDIQFPEDIAANLEAHRARSGVNERSRIWNPPGELPVEIVPAYATGTRGRYMNFGSGTPAILHGRERVMTEAEGRMEAANMHVLVAEMQGLRSDFGWIRSTMPLALRDAVMLSR